jgi:hypothetical protein
MSRSGVVRPRRIAADVLQDEHRSPPRTTRREWEVGRKAKQRTLTDARNPPRLSSPFNERLAWTHATVVHAQGRFDDAPYRITGGALTAPVVGRILSRAMGCVKGVNEAQNSPPRIYYIQSRAISALMASILDDATRRAS